MLALEEGDLQFKYWRPFVLFLCAIDGDANYIRQRGMLDALAQLVRRGKGLALVNGVVVDEVAEHSLRKARKARRGRGPDAGTAVAGSAATRARARRSRGGESVVGLIFVPSQHVDVRPPLPPLREFSGENTRV